MGKVYKTNIDETKAKHHTQDEINWCAGCGNFGIWGALQKALAQAGKEPHEVVLVGDIGCSGKLPYWTEYNGFASLHGRAIPVAEGIKLANSGVTVMVFIGDGGALNEGLQHFVHAARRNADINVILHNNQLYGLTKGQTSPTSEQGFESSTTPRGSYEVPLNPIAIALTANASFVASSFSGNVDHLTEMIGKAIEHPGFSYVDVYQPCVTYNYINTYQYYAQRTYKLEDTEYLPNRKANAWLKSQEIDVGEQYPLGVFYEDRKPTLNQEVVHSDRPLVETPLKGVDVSEAFTRDAS